MSLVVPEHIELQSNLSKSAIPAKKTSFGLSEGSGNRSISLINKEKNIFWGKHYFLIIAAVALTGSVE